MSATKWADVPADLRVEVLDVLREALADARRMAEVHALFADEIELARRHCPRVNRGEQRALAGWHRLLGEAIGAALEHLSAEDPRAFDAPTPDR